MAEQSGRSGRQLGLYVPVETADKLKALSERTDIPQSRLLRQALQLLFEKYDETPSRKPARVRKWIEQPTVTNSMRGFPPEQTLIHPIEMDSQDLTMKLRWLHRTSVATLYPALLTTLLLRLH
jgi:predicted DNA-binding protein